jgi:hypothetical protein
VHSLIGVADRVVLLESGPDRLELCLRVGECRVGAQPADGANEMAAAIGCGAIESTGDEDVGLSLGIGLDVLIVDWQDSDDRRGTRVEQDGLADDVRIAAVASLPRSRG